MKLTTLTRNTALALGISALSTQSMLAATPKNNVTYLPHVNLGTFYQNDNQSFLEADFFIPLFSTATSLPFLDARILDREGGSFEGNLGGGYRQLVDDTWLWGVYSFYDARQSPKKNFFQQLVFGGELKNHDWALTANTYVPLGKTQYRKQNASVQLSATADNRVSNIVYVNDDNQEFALNGVDWELAYTFALTPAKQRDLELSLGGGSYHFWHEGVKSINGGRMRTTFDWWQPAQSSVVDKVSFEVSMQYDKVREFAILAGARISFAFGGELPQDRSPLQRKMTEYVRRDIDVVTKAVNNSSQDLATDANGDLLTVYSIKSEQDLTDAKADNASHIYAIDGDFTMTDVHQLNDAIVVTGGFYDDNGTLVQVANGGHITQTNDNAAIFDVGQDNILRDFSASRDYSDASNGVRALITNVNAGIGTDVNTIHIENVKLTDGGINLLFNGSNSATSNVYLQNNQLVFNDVTPDIITGNLYGGYDYSAGINLSVEQGNTLRIKQLSGQDIRFVNANRNDIEVIGIALTGEANTSTLISEAPITNNIIRFIGDASFSHRYIDRIGIAALGDFSNMQLLGGISHNRIDFASNDTSSGSRINEIGIDLEDVTFVSNIDYNHIRFTGNKVDAKGTYIGFDGTGIQLSNSETAQSISHNNILFSGSLIDPYNITHRGIVVDSVNELSRIDGNVISFMETTDSKKGVYLTGIRIEDVAVMDSLSNNLLLFANEAPNTTRATQTGINIDGNNDAISYGKISANTMLFNSLSQHSSQGIRIQISGISNSIQEVDHNLMVFSPNSQNIGMTIESHSYGLNIDSLANNVFYNADTGIDLFSDTGTLQIMLNSATTLSEANGDTRVITDTMSGGVIDIQ